MDCIEKKKKLFAKRNLDKIMRNIQGDKFILYPYGQWGKWVEKLITEKYKKTPYLIIDNQLASPKDNIYTVEKLKYIDKNTHIIITCQSGKLCKQIEQSVTSLRDDLKIEFMFSKNGLPSELNDFWMRKAIYKKLDETNVEENGMIYNLSKYKSRFFLPYLYMDTVQKFIFLYDDYYEVDNLKKVFSLFNGQIAEAVASTHGLVLDIGANIGNHAIYFVNEMNAPKVVCFEAVPENFRILKKNIALNKLDERIEAHCVGVSDKDEKFSPPFYRYENVGGTSLENVFENYRPIDMELLNDDELIHCHSIDSYRFQNVTLMKIDVEGMELKVLQGALHTIETCKPYIMCESFPDKFKHVQNLLQKLGYDYVLINEVSSDYLFYHK